MVLFRLLYNGVNHIYHKDYSERKTSSQTSTHGMVPGVQEVHNCLGFGAMISYTSPVA